MTEKLSYKEMVKLQVKLEMTHAKNNSIDLMKMFLYPLQDEIAEAMENLIFKILDHTEEDYYYQTKDGEIKYWEAKKIQHDYIVDHLGILGLMDVCYAMYVALLPAKQAPTLQQIVGSMHGYFKGIEGVKRQLQAIEMVLEEIPFATMHAPKGAEYAYLYPSGIELDPEEKEAFALQGTALPSIVRPKKVRNNRSIGYRTFNKSLIMGGKAHDKECNLDHINRRNAVAFRLEPRVRDLVTPEFNNEFKRCKKTGALETEVEREERRVAWQDKQDILPVKMAAVVGKPLYFAHRYDNRYRTYAEQYHLNYQGDCDDKAILELYKKEAIQGDW